MKILYVTTIGITMRFFPEHIKMLLAEGHTVELACNYTAKPVPEIYHKLGVKIHNIPFSRSPLSKENVVAYRRFRVIVEQGNYDVVHTHTPNASVIVRLACRTLRKQGLKVFYTAHGFHFYKGAPLKNWLVFYPVEWVCACWTDTLITINKEDYALAQKHMHAKKVEYVPGVGIDLNNFSHKMETASNRQNIRELMGCKADDIVLLSVGELNKNKNHESVIRALETLKVHLWIAGEGELKETYQEIIQELCLTDRVKLLGYRSDVQDLYAAADIFVFPSFREGLSVSLMEAMACGLPCAVSRIRGNIDLLDENGGELFDPHDVIDVQSALIQILKRDGKVLGTYNAKKIRTFDVAEVVDKMKQIYGIE